MMIKFPKNYVGLLLGCVLMMVINRVTAPLLDWVEKGEIYNENTRYDQTRNTMPK